MGLEAPWVGSPPESPEPPDNWIDEEEMKKLELILELTESTVEEFEDVTLEDDLDGMKPFLEVAKALARETQDRIDNSITGDDWMWDE